MSIHLGQLALGRVWVLSLIWIEKKSSLKSENAIFLPNSTTNRGIGITQYGLSSLGSPILSPFMMHKVQNLPNQCPQDKAESGYSIAWGPAN